MCEQQDQLLIRFKHFISSDATVAWTDLYKSNSRTVSSSSPLSLFLQDLRTLHFLLGRILHPGSKYGQTLATLYINASVSPLQWRSRWIRQHTCFKGVCSFLLTLLDNRLDLVKSRGWKWAWQHSSTHLSSSLLDLFVKCEVARGLICDTMC